MSKKIMGVLITPNDPDTLPRKFTMEYNDYTDFYKILECSTFDIQVRKFKYKWFDIYMDDNGKLKEDNQVSLITIDGYGNPIEFIVGNVFIVNHNEEGDTISLTEEEVKLVLSTIQTVKLTNKKTNQSVLTTVGVIEV
ncbi:MAG: DUF3846 domain-containing protein [Bacilli bacterium]|nr:DUF3846 domain-containing protein [Bacilli bacterium]